MKKIFWTLSLAALGAAAGCESLLGDEATGPSAGRGADQDPDLTVDDGASCEKESLDAVGCTCSAGAPARSCFVGSIEEAGKGACTWGTQACETTTDSEFDTSVWGPCVDTGAATAETCDNGRDDDCNGVIDDCGGDTNGSGGGDENDCCSDRLADCLASGASASSCATLETICRGESCDGLVQACDPTALPVSAQCANAYYQCFGFRVNKCMRESLSSCVAAMADEALCAAWDAACTAREQVCAELLGGGTGEPPDPGNEEGKNGEDGKLGGPYGYYCTDWGHIFDPCWDAYESCNLEPAVCEMNLSSCASLIGDIYSPICGPGEGPNDGPGSGEGGKDDPPKP